MIATIYPGALRGTVRVPASKSAAHRALICAALADGPTRVEIGALNADIEATIRCLAALGARVTRENGALCVEPIPAASGTARNGDSAKAGADDEPIPPASRKTEGGDPAEAGADKPLPCAARTSISDDPATAGGTRAAGTGEGIILDCGESGSTLRFLLPVAAALGVPACFTGRGRLPERPNAALTGALRAHGADIDADLLPMRVRGPVAGGRWTLPGDVSSQYVTGLLLALPLLPEDSQISLTTPLESAAYVTMTLEALRQFGIVVEPTTDGWRVPGGQRYRSPENLAVESDWSAAAFWCAANAIGASIHIEGLNPDSAQGDRAVTELLKRNAVDARNVPDLVPALAVAAIFRPGRTVISGAARLRLKESDRLAATAAMANALGARAAATEDGLIIDGRGKGCAVSDTITVDGANDHRIVMAAAIAASAHGAPVRVLGAEAVEKSYPDFFRDFEQLGGHIHVE